MPSLGGKFSSRSSVYYFYIKESKKSLTTSRLDPIPLSPPLLTQTQQLSVSSAFIWKMGLSTLRLEPGWPSCTLGLQGSLWEDVNSAPCLLQKRVTRDLLDPWSRAWSTGSVREAEVKPCRAGAETSPRTEAESPEHRKQSSPLGCWGGDGAGWAGSSVTISPDFLRLSGWFWEVF